MRAVVLLSEKGGFVPAMARAALSAPVLYWGWYVGVPAYVCVCLCVCVCVCVCVSVCSVCVRTRAGVFAMGWRLCGCCDRAGCTRACLCARHDRSLSCRAGPGRRSLEREWRAVREELPFAAADAARPRGVHDPKTCGPRLLPMDSIFRELIVNKVVPGRPVTPPRGTAVQSVMVPRDGKLGVPREVAPPPPKPAAGAPPPPPPRREAAPADKRAMSRDDISAAFEELVRGRVGAGLVTLAEAGRLLTETGLEAELRRHAGASAWELLARYKQVTLGRDVFLSIGAPRAGRGKAGAAAAVRAPVATAPAAVAASTAPAAAAAPASAGVKPPTWAMPAVAAAAASSPRTAAPAVAAPARNSAAKGAGGGGAGAAAGPVSDGGVRGGGGGGVVSALEASIRAELQARELKKQASSGDSNVSDGGVRGAGGGVVSALEASIRAELQARELKKQASSGDSNDGAAAAATVSAAPPAAGAPDGVPGAAAEASVVGRTAKVARVVVVAEGPITAPGIPPAASTAAASAVDVSSPVGGTTSDAAVAGAPTELSADEAARCAAIVNDAASAGLVHGPGVTLAALKVLLSAAGVPCGKRAHVSTAVRLNMTARLVLASEAAVRGAIAARATSVGAETVSSDGGMGSSGGASSSSGDSSEGALAKCAAIVQAAAAAGALSGTKITVPALHALLTAAKVPFVKRKTTLGVAVQLVVAHEAAVRDAAAAAAAAKQT
jgi:hypothetical protein